MYLCLFPKTRCLISLLITSKCQLFKKRLFSGILGSKQYFCVIDTNGSRRATSLTSMQCQDQISHQTGLELMRLLACVTRGPSREPYQTIGTVYLILGILRTDLWSQGSLVDYLTESKRMVIRLLLLKEGSTLIQLNFLA